MARILIADDDPVFGEVTALMLEERGHDVTLTLDGEAAMKAVRPDTEVALIDIFMPVKDGLEVIVELRQTRPDMRVIAVSSTEFWNRADQLATARALGAHAALAKPMDGDGLHDLIERLLDGRASHSNFVTQ